jgi:F-type H+-transporting ATPase subunit delta
MNSAQEIADGILQLLEKRNLMHLLPQIVDILNSHLAQKNRFNTAIVKTAIPLTDTQRAQLQKQLSAMFGRSLRIDEQIDSSIIGGMYIQIGDTVLDYTLQSRLKQIREQLET